MERLSVWEVRIIRVGIFLVFVITFGDYIFRKIQPVIGAWFQ
jgi:hypothetical protein